MPLQKILVLLLSGAAGAIDAASYIGLGHVFVANMTGNTVHFAMALGRASPIDIGRAGSALVGFLVGAAIGALLVERDDSPLLWPRAVTISLCVELTVLVAIALMWLDARTHQPTVAVLLLLGLGIAMGMQSATVRRLRIPGVASTYLTGTLTMLAAGLVRRASGRSAAPEAPTHGAVLLISVWAVYAAGAAIVTVTARNGGPRSLVLPILLLSVVLAGADRRAAPAPHVS